MRTKRLFTFLALALVLLMAFGYFSGASANDALEDVTEIDCDPNAGTEAATHYTDAGDKDAAVALKDAGYICTGLFNKGQLPSTFQQVGELWHLTAGTQHHIRIIFFGGDNTGFGESKICLDDDPDPINDIAPGGDSPAFCTGGDWGQSFEQGFDGGPSYPPAKAADVAPEEAAGKFEIAIENLVEISETFGGTAVGGWNINIDDYTEALPHFNKGGFSIVAYYQPKPKTNINVTKSDDIDPIYLGQTLTYSLLVENTTQVPAANVEVEDTLPLDVTFVSATPSQGSCDPLSPGTGPGGEDQVFCDLGTIGAFGSATVTIEVTITSDMDACNTTITNAVEVSTTTEETNLNDNLDTEDTRISCAAVQVNKVYKNAATADPNDTLPLAGAGFELWNAGNTAKVRDQILTNAKGIACFDHLPLNTAFTFVESSTPAGFAGADPTPVNSGAVESDCESVAGAPVSVTITNTPLTNITWSVNSQVDGGTRTTVDCKDANGTSLPDYPMTVEDGTDTLENLLPTAPGVTVTCDFTVDP